MVGLHLEGQRLRRVANNFLKVRLVQQIEKLADVVAVLERMTQTRLPTDRVGIPATLFLHLQNPLGSELSENSLNRPLSNPHLIG